MTEPLRVNPSIVATAANALSRTAAALLDDVAVLGGATGPRPGPDGWPVTAALRAALDSTMGCLTGLGGDLRGVGDHLASSAAAYPSADQRAVGRLHAATW